MDSSSLPVAFILDFDGTVTQKDTIFTIAHFGIECQKARGKNLENDWRLLYDTYVESYSRSLHGYTPAEADRKTLAEEVTYQRNLRSLELWSFTHVGKSGIFKQIGDDQWRKFAKDTLAKGDVNVREGFDSFVKQVSKSKATWGVVSVNFASQFIRGVLAASAGAGAAEVEVLANQPDEEGMLQGPNGGPVMATSDAKLAAMNGLLQKWKSESMTGFSKVIYIGDSGTDIECLTAEGVIGIAMSSDGTGTLIDILKRIGPAPVHVSSQHEGQTSSLYWARNFEEIIQSPLFGSKVGKVV
ncbi:hypothetical protein BKA65DRAFT_546165 [Rhexocercosporidium sp. MPI-PUGE-AT-0058]|nr:hypothetical protein BKA65DRAFT_546165 [Rhexocercosporidium sp. MPI-PUGE-AT-0058]